MLGYVFSALYLQEAKNLGNVLAMIGNGVEHFRSR